MVSGVHNSQRKPIIARRGPLRCRSATAEWWPHGLGERLRQGRGVPSGRACTATDPASTKGNQKRRIYCCSRLGSPRVKPPCCRANDFCVLVVVIIVVVVESPCMTAERRSLSSSSNLNSCVSCCPKTSRIPALRPAAAPLAGGVLFSGLKPSRFKNLFSPLSRVKSKI